MPATPRYHSTRGHGPVSLADAMVQGLAPDGGLYLPEPLPRVSLPAPGPLPELAPALLAPYLPEGSGSWIRDALSFDTPLVEIGPSRYLMDLTRGPTAAFKDVGARFLARGLSALAPAPAGRVRTVLVATSGDTGGAVAAAFDGVPGVRVVVLFPAEGVSPRQRRQFTTRGPGVVALGVEGPFDDCQRLVKEALSDPELRDAGLLTSANSINVGRLLPQTTWYLKALAELDGPRAPVTFVVPSGNLGNLTAGLLASLTADHAVRFVAAVNDNDAFASWLAGRPASRADTVRTPSSAMDVGRPSNLERIEALVERHPALRRRMTAVVVDAEATLRRMATHHRATGRFVDPHTAVGLAALDRLDAAGPPPGPVVVLATADAGKFPDTVRDATGSLPPVPEALRGLDALQEAWTRVPPRLDALRRVLHTDEAS